MKHQSGQSRHQQLSASLYEALIACDRVILRSDSQADLFSQVCRELVQLSEIDAAWIGTVDAGDTRVWPQAHHGKNQFDPDFIKTMVLMDARQAHTPVSRAIRENQAMWVQDIQNDPAMVDHREWAEVRGWRANVVLPLSTGGLPVGILSIYATTIHAFDVVAQELLIQLASNISCALDHFAHDVQRRLAEDTLAESEARYSALFANNCMPMLLVNPDDARIVDANIRAINYYGWDLAKLTSMKVMDINTLSPEDIRREMMLAARTGKTYFDFKHRLASGDIRDVEVFSSPVDFGGQTYLLSMVHDVTERRRDQAEVKNMHVMVQQFIDELPGTVFLKDSHLRLLMVNKNLGKDLGVDSNSLIGKTAHEIFPKNFADAITDLDQQLLRTGGKRTVAEIFNNRHLETSLFAIDDARGERLLGGLSIDVTERHRAAELTAVLLQINALGGQLPEKEFLTQGLEMAQALTNSEIAFLHFVNDDQETLELVTWTAWALTGCTAAFDTHYPVSHAGIWADSLREKKAVVFNDYANYPAKKGLPDGHTTLTRLISAPIVEDGQVRMMMGVGNKTGNYDDADVDALSLIGNDLWRIVRRARAEATLHKRVEELVAVNKKLADVQVQLLQSEKMASIGQLAAGVAHEINNPIGFVKSNLGTLSAYVQELLALLKDYADVERQLGDPHTALFEGIRQRKQASDFSFMATDLPQLIEESREGVGRVSQIVLDLKNFSRAGDNEWRWADLQAGIESTINVVWNQLKYKVQVTREFAVLPQVYCVASQINQVVMNLLVNAEQAISERGHITIRTGVTGDQVWIEVQDDGCGITLQNQARIFEPFYTSKPVGLGTGLGLSIVSGIVSRHQGHIVLRSEPGVGSTFRVVLPIHAEPSMGLNQATGAQTGDPS